MSLGRTNLGRSFHFTGIWILVGLESWQGISLTRIWILVGFGIVLVTHFHRAGKALLAFCPLFDEMVFIIWLLCRCLILLKLWSSTTQTLWSQQAGMLQEKRRRAKGMWLMRLDGGISPGSTPMLPLRWREASLLSMCLLVSITIGTPDPCIGKAFSLFPWGIIPCSASSSDGWCPPRLLVNISFPSALSSINLS